MKNHPIKVALMLVVSAVASVGADDTLSSILEAVGSEMASASTINFDPNGLEVALRSNVPVEIQSQATQYDQELVSANQLAGNSEKVENVKNILNKLFPNVHNKNKNFTIRIFESEEVNAFTTGSSYIYVYTALLDEAESDDELAGILGHELAHVDAGHCGMRQGSRSWMDLTATVAQLTTKGKKREQIGNIHSGISATFSREYEMEADVLGALAAHRAGYDPRKMADFFERQMEKEMAQHGRALATLNQQRQQLDVLKKNVDLAKAYYERTPTQQMYAQYERHRRNYNAEVARYNDNVARTNQYLKGGSPWQRSHPFDASRKQRILEVSDYLERRINRSDITDPVLLKVLQTVEKVEGKRIQ